jgi:hypothetical protein
LVIILNMLETPYNQIFGKAHRRAIEGAPSVESGGTCVPPCG